jgi:hypothetical protein
MTIVRVRVVEGTEVVIEVGPQFGVAAGVARRLRSEGLNARQVRGEVVVLPSETTSSATEIGT